MTTSAITNQHPRFGFNEVRPYTGTLTQASLVGTSFARTSGLFQLCIVGDFTLTAGAGEVNIILEGSNDGGFNWTALDSLSPATYLIATGQVSLDVDVERWDLLRVRAAIVSGAPTFSLVVYTVGIHGDSEKFLRTETLVRSMAGGEDGAVQIRPRGTKFVNVQSVATGVVLDGGTSFDLILEGSPNYVVASPLLAVWTELGRITITANGSQVMVNTVDLTRLIDLECYSWFRFRSVDVGPVGLLGAYTISAYLSMDSGDWVLVSTSGSGGSTPGLDEAVLQVAFGAPGAEAGDTRTLPFFLLDGNGDPIVGVKRVEFLVYDTTNAGDLDLALIATFAAVGGGATAIAGTGTNRVLVDTDAVGQGTLDILDAAVETVFVTGVQPRAPLAVKQLIWQAAEATLAFV